MIRESRGKTSFSLLILRGTGTKARYGKDKQGKSRIAASRARANSGRVDFIARSEENNDDADGGSECGLRSDWRAESAVIVRPSDDTLLLPILSIPTPIIINKILFKLDDKTGTNRLLFPLTATQIELTSVTYKHSLHRATIPYITSAMNNNQVVRARERVPTGRRGRPSKSMIAAALERPFCAYLHKICLNNRLEGHKYCIDHIMNDKTAPYRQCTYVHSVTGRRCTRAAHKVDRRASPLCQYHRAIRLNAPPAPTPVSIEETNSDSKTLLDELAHHDPNQTTQTPCSNAFWVPKTDGSAVPSTKLCKIIAKYNAQRLAEEKVQIELPTVEDIAARHNNADSDTESVDNNLDMFKHASVFTEEEVTRTLRDKMIKLRRLYIEQYGHVQYILKEKRLKYIQAQRMEDELYGEQYSFRNHRDSQDYPKLRAMLRYHKTFGPESLLQEQAKKKRMSRPPTVGPHPHTNNQHQCHSEKEKDKEKEVAADTKVEVVKSERTQICIFSKTPQGCDNPCLPLSPYCKAHILYDTKQVLFRPCAGGMPPCLNPVVSFVRKNKCRLHTAIN